MGSFPFSMGIKKYLTTLRKFLVSRSMLHQAKLTFWEVLRIWELVLKKAVAQMSAGVGVNRDDY